MADTNRNTNSAQLQLWDTSAARPDEQLPADDRNPPRYYRRTRAAERCPSCGHRAASAAEDARMRADIGVLWLHPDPTAPDGAREVFHCQSCQPRPVADIECARCSEGGPLLADQFAAEAAAGRVPAQVAAWLTARGWHVEGGEVSCPAHR